jgi:molybdopterin-guanine dinucleotide biosynthesis protein B
LPELIAAGLKVSTLKHAHHAFDIDRPGKDSYVHRMAGATEVMVGSANRWALMHELRGDAEPSMADLVKRMTPVDLLLVEGFKRDSHDKLEVFRRANGKPLLAPSDPRVVAIASDGPVPETRLPVLDLNDVPTIARFVLRHAQAG